MKTIAALFDCDGTLYSAQFGRGLLKYAAEHGRKGAVRAYYAAILLPYTLGKFGFTDDEKHLRPVIANLARLVRGMSEQEGGSLFAWVTYEYLLPTQRTDVITRLREHQSQDHAVVLVSGAFVPYLAQLAQSLNVTGYVGTQLEILNGYYTGRIIPPVITGCDKYDFTHEFFSSRGLEVDWEASYAYADSSTDLGLMELVGHPVAVYPDPKLQIHAQEAGWEIIGNGKA
jgi:HAD superfamily hydrolase (TIGR01490 family)